MAFRDPAGLTVEPLVRAELSRVLSSPEFEGADRMSALLKFLVTTTLEGRSDHLKEPVIGVQVFNREIGYDTKLDPVVRVSAGRLRQRLLKFYERTGAPPAVRIVIPKGGYVPEFLPSGQPEAATPEPGLPPPPPLPAATPRSRRLGLIALAAVLLLSATAFYLVRQASRAPSLAGLIRDGQPFTNFSGSVLHPSFSPDGRTIAYDWSGPNDDNRDIWIHRIDADAPARLTSDPEIEVWPVWSPDGGWIAFLRVIDGPAAVLVLKPALGGSERVLARFLIGPNDRPRLDWSRDGKWFVTADRPEPKAPMRLLLVDAASGSYRPITAPPPGTGGDSEPAFSPDGRAIAFRRTVSAGVEDVYLIPFAGGPLRRLTMDNRGVSALAWRADGESLIVSSRRAGSLRQLWEFPLRGGAPSRLSPAAMDAGSPAVSRDGRALIFVQTHEDKNIYALDLTDPQAKPRRVIASPAPDMDPALSPDGALLAFRSLRTGADEIWIAAADGSNERRLTRMGGPVVGSAKWFPDGSALVFSVRAGPKGDVHTVSVPGGEARAVTPPASNESGPFVSPEGQWLYFSSDRSGAPEIWRQPLSSQDGAGAQQITKGGGGGPKLSPNGTALFYVRPQSPGRPPALLELPLSGAVFPAEGRPIADLDNRLTGHWTVARGGVYFVSLGSAPPPVLNCFDFSTRRIVPKAPLPGRLSAFDGGLAISPDEKTVFYTALDRLGSNLVLGRQEE